MSIPSIPDSFTLGTTLGGNVGATLGGTVGLDATVTGDPTKPLSMLVLGDPQKPITAGLELLNLPRFTVQDIQKLMTMQVSLPGHGRFCFKVLGVELFQFCFGGEGKVTAQPYQPQDHCSEPVCQVDTRPFPKGDVNPNG